MIQKLKKLDNTKALKLLKISLLINILFISIFIGHLAFDNKKHHKRGFMKHHVIDKQTMRQYRLEMRAKKIEVENALLEQPYNKQRVIKAFKDLDLHMDNVRDQINDAIVEKAASLDPQERLELLSPHLRKRIHKAKNKQ